MQPVCLSTVTFRAEFSSVSPSAFRSLAKGFRARNDVQHFVAQRWNFVDSDQQLVAVGFGIAR